MNTKHWVAAGVGMVLAFALLAGNVQAADDNTSYQFRVVNHSNKATYIRCRSSDAWTTIAIGGTTNISCSQSTAETRMEGGAVNDNTNNCPSSRPVLRIKYSGYWVGLNFKLSVGVGCRA